MPTEYLILILVGLFTVLLPFYVHSSREEHKKREYVKKFNPIVLDDKGRKRYFSWHSRDPVDLIKIECQDQQLLDFLVPLSNAIHKHTNMKLQFSFSDKLQGEIVYELSKDFQSKWRLPGGKGNRQGDQVLVILPL